MSEMGFVEAGLIPIEGQLNSFIEGLLLIADSLKKRRAEDEERRRREEEIRRQRELEEEQRNQLKLKIDDLILKTDNWHESQRIRNFIDTFESVNRSNLDSKTIEWIAWARNYADSVDPMFIKDKD